ncbi:hypothetical protein pb186bvf_005095 [Paramecium bursaria]
MYLDSPQSQISSKQQYSQARLQENYPIKLMSSYDNPV